MPRLSLEFQYDKRDGENVCTIKTVNNMDIISGKIVFFRDYVTEDGNRHVGYIHISFSYNKKEDGSDTYVNEGVYNKIYLTPEMLDCIDVLDDVLMCAVYRTLYKIYIVRRLADLYILETKNPSPQNIKTNFDPFIDYIKEELYKEVSGK